MFHSLDIRDHKAIALLKKAIVLILAVLLIIGILASYRAYVQVRRLELHSKDRLLRGGSAIHFAVVSSGRTPVDVRLELIQGAHFETLFILNVPDNTYAFFDPRAQHASETVVLTPDLLARFQNGPGLVRVTATGRPQWTRLPPPTVRELSVRIQP